MSAFSALSLLIATASLFSFLNYRLKRPLKTLSPRLKRQGWVLGTLALPLVACVATTPPPATPTAAAPAAAAERRSPAASRVGTDQIVVDAALEHAEPASVIAAWILYATARSALWHARTDTDRPDRAADDFSTELVARESLAAYWERKRATGAAPNPNLDLMVTLAHEKLFEPYVLSAFSLPGWTVPSRVLATMDLPAFDAWAEQHLVGHKPMRGAMFLPGDARLRPEPPGATLPAPATFAAERVPCASSRAALDAALSQWSEAERRLDGAPLAAADRAAFLRALAHARTLPPFSDRGATWVSARVTDLYYIAGFCAADQQRWADAERLLLHAAALAPLETAARNELSGVYTRTRRFDEASALLAESLPLAKNDCERARVLRGQGFISVERGKLREAFDIYMGSLKLDPGSAIARRELEFVTRSLRARGGPDATIIEATPLPSKTEVYVTSCPR